MRKTRTLASLLLLACVGTFSATAQKPFLRSFPTGHSSSLTKKTTPCFVDAAAVAAFGGSGYRAPAGRFSDARYIISGSSVPLEATVRNVGTCPDVTVSARYVVERLEPNGTWKLLFAETRKIILTVGSDTLFSFGCFPLQTLGELAYEEPFFGAHPNITPRYRFRLSVGDDDNTENDVTESIIRFYTRQSLRKRLVSVETLEAAAPGNPVALGNRLNSDSLLTLLEHLQWERAGTRTVQGDNDYDVMERDRWPVEALDFRYWNMVIWAQGGEPQGLEPEERRALKAFLDSGETRNGAGLILFGQEVAAVHDVPSAGPRDSISDREFVRDYLGAVFVKRLNPGVGFGLGPWEPGTGCIRNEQLGVTGELNDRPPRLSHVRPNENAEFQTVPLYRYADIPGVPAGLEVRHPYYRAVIFLPWDIRHCVGRADGKFGAEFMLLCLAGRLASVVQPEGYFRPETTIISWVLEIQHIVGSLVQIESYSSELINPDPDPCARHAVSAVVERALVTKPDGTPLIPVFDSLRSLAPIGEHHVFYDDDLLPEALYEYRLSVTYNNGEKATFGPYTVGGSRQPLLRIFPNPVRGLLSLQCNVPDKESYRLRFFNSIGEEIRTIGRIEGEVRRLLLNVDDWLPGTYHVLLEIENGIRIDQAFVVLP